jgi:hypothetical protein
LYIENFEKTSREFVTNGHGVDIFLCVQTSLTFSLKRGVSTSPEDRLKWVKATMNREVFRPVLAEL